MKMNLKKNDFGGLFSNTFIQSILIIWGIIQISPIFWLFYSSFKTSPEISRNIFAFPNSLYLENYNLNRLASQNITILTYFKNSIIITSVSLILVTIVSVLAAYAIAKIKFPGKNVILLLLIGTIGIPIHSLLIPLYYLISKFNLVNNYFGLILPYTAFFAPFSIIILQAYFRQFPDEIIDAAKIDGCSKLRIFWSIIMPVSIAGISSILIFNFISIWNEFLFSLVIMKNNTSKTLPVGLMSLVGKYSTEWGPMIAGLVIAIVPVIIFYIFFHKNIIRGVSAGAIKE